MDEKTYECLQLHLESVRFIVANLEAALRLSRELDPAVYTDVPGDMAVPDDAGAVADAFAKMLDHLGKMETKLAFARRNVEKMAKLCQHEIEFAEVDK